MSNESPPTQGFFGFLKKIPTAFSHLFLLIIRVYWGYSFFSLGKEKLLNIGIKTDFFSSINVPFPEQTLILVGATELICGALLVAGFLSRLASIPLIITMLSAYAIVYREALLEVFIFPEGFFEAAPFIYLLVCLTVFAFGPGIISLEALIKKWRGPSKTNSQSQSIEEIYEDISIG